MYHSDMGAEQLLSEVIIPLVQESNRVIPGFCISNPSADSKVFGSEGAPLDSFALVNFVFALEKAVEEKLGVRLQITVEDVLHQESNPFQSLSSLAVFVSRKTQPEK